MASEPSPGKLKVVMREVTQKSIRKELCRTHFIQLCGEKIKRGCGQRGLVPTSVGFRCLYCGFYKFHCRAGYDDWWSFFRTGREYWRWTLHEGREYINGVPVPAPAESVPWFLVADLQEVKVPLWFPFFLACDPYEFGRFLESRGKPRK